MNTPVNRNGFAQICVIVPDIEKAAAKWAEIFGCEKPKIWKNHLEGGENYTYRGEPVSCDLLVTVFEMPGFVLELHEVLDGPSSFKEYIEKHGYGVHHLGFEVGDARDAVIDSLKDAGFDTNRTLGIYPGSSWTIVDSEDVLGVNLNIKPVR